MIEDKELIEPKESEYGECENCQDEKHIDELFEIRLYKNAYRSVCQKCKKHYKDMEESDE